MGNVFYKVSLNSQPTETTCGPTCLHGIYKFYGEDEHHQSLIDVIPFTSGGGTLGVLLAIDAVKKGFDCEIYSHNLNVFDPSWFKLTSSNLIEKLITQSKCKPEPKLIEASRLYAEFLRLGGRIKFAQLTPQFIYELLLQNGPLICGLSATYLYFSQREIDDTCEYDDVKGYPQGHFVVVAGMSSDLKEIQIADPLEQNPLKKGQYYTVDSQHFINSVLIGVITYDANFLVLKKKIP